MVVISICKYFPLILFIHDGPLNSVSVFFFRGLKTSSISFHHTFTSGFTLPVLFLHSLLPLSSATFTFLQQLLFPLSRLLSC